MGMENVLRKISIPGRATAPLVLSKDDSRLHLISSDKVTRTDLYQEADESTFSACNSEWACDYGRIKLHDFGGFVKKTVTPQWQ